VAESSSGQVPTTEEIVSALSRTGFILEYRVAQALRRLGYDASVSYAYPDPESGKSREIDVFATIDHDITRPPVEIVLTGELIIECKNSFNPFVLVGERGQDRSYYDDSVMLSFDPLYLEFPGAKPHNSIRANLKLARLPGSAGLEEFVGYQLIRMNQQNNIWRADNTGIYDSILYPLAKAWRYRIRANTVEPQESAEEDEGDEIEEAEAEYEEEEEEEERSFPDWDFLSLSYFFPIIVTAGPVFTVDVTGQEPEVNEVKWARLKRTFSSKEMSTDLRADLVAFRHFESYLEARVNKVLASAENVLATNIHFFDPEWLVSNLGEPKYKRYFDDWINGIRSRRQSV
jgi:hypothetical protein